MNARIVLSFIVAWLFESGFVYAQSTLVNPIFNVISLPSQMNFMGHRMTGGVFAPAIEHFKGIFYMTCTLIHRETKHLEYT